MLATYALWTWRFLNLWRWTWALVWVFSFSLCVSHTLFKALILMGFRRKLGHLYLNPVCNFWERYVGRQNSSFPPPEVPNRGANLDRSFDAHKEEVTILKTLNPADIFIWVDIWWGCKNWRGCTYCFGPLCRPADPALCIYDLREHNAARVSSSFIYKEGWAIQICFDWVFWKRSER